MPKITELKNIRSEIASIGDEVNVLAEWGETYEELPEPSVDDVLDGADDVLGVLDDIPGIEPAAPLDIGLDEEPNVVDNSVFDSVLSNIDLDNGTQENVTSFPEVPEDFLAPDAQGGFQDSGEPIFTEASDINEALFDTTDFNAEEISDFAEPENAKANTDSFASEPFSGEAPLPPESPFDEESQFHDLDSDFSKASDFAIDESVVANSFDTSEPETLGDENSSFNFEDFDISSFDSEPVSDDANFSDSNFGSVGFSESGFENDSKASTSQSLNAQDDFSTLSSETTSDASFDFSTEDFGSTDFGGSDFSSVMENASDDFATTDFSNADFGGNFSPVGSSENSSESTLDDGFSDTSDFSNISFTDDDFDFDSSGAFVGKAGGTGETSTESPEEDAYAPVQEVTNVQVPEMDEKTDFIKKSSDGFDGSFAPPEKFETFAEDNSAHSFTVHKASSSSDADVQDGIPLSITEKDFQRFLQILDGMPLNLRKEIQHYIAYDKDSEVNKMKLVNLMLSNTSINKVVKYLEETLNKSIKIPKGFDKKSFEEFEREKQTLKYKLRYKVLPLVSISAIITLIVCSVLVVAWQFIYKPIMSESYYKDGLYYIENGQNNTAIEKFDKAGTYWKKKRWYFKYGEEFRTKKQYSAAESIYLRLLTDFNHDPEGGIAYADMLSRELRDYAKAETVLKRQVLDYHPESDEAFYALGNVYLEWGLENDSKLVEAEKIFSQLLLKDSTNADYNAGMMKYYIRTNNLEKVLAFKDFFLEKGRKISVDDLTELGGYLVQCRYESTPNISETIKNKIDDLREILEMPVKMQENHPEANYNLGRFFVYNYKPTEAEFYLERAIKNYGNETLPLSQFFKKLDAMRLYGELLLDKGQHLEAETVFSNALTQYRTYSAISPLPENKIVGKLFEDYGDVRYFIANDYDSALSSYNRASVEQNDSASLRYKIGFILYQFGSYEQAASEFARAVIDLPNDKNVLFALGNALFKRANYQGSQAYYERLLENLDAEKLKRNVLLPQIRESDSDFVEKYMKTSNNLGVALHRIAVQTGSSEANSRAFVLFAESTRAWDALTRNPETYIRVKNQQAPAYVNVHYMSVPYADFVPEIYTDIPKTIENARVY